MNDQIEELIKVTRDLIDINKELVNDQLEKEND